VRKYLSQSSGYSNPLGLVTSQAQSNDRNMSSYADLMGSFSDFGAGE
jgi:hypothetical protein